MTGIHFTLGKGEIGEYQQQYLPPVQTEMPPSG